MNAEYEIMDLDPLSLALARAPPSEHPLPSSKRLFKVI